MYNSIPWHYLLKLKSGFDALKYNYTGKRTVIVHAVDTSLKWSQDQNMLTLTF